MVNTKMMKLWVILLSLMMALFGGLLIYNPTAISVFPELIHFIAGGIFVLAGLLGIFGGIRMKK